LLTGRSYGLLAFTELGLKKILAEKVGKGWKLQWTCTETATELRRGREEAASARAEDTIQLHEEYSENKMPSVVFVSSDTRQVSWEKRCWFLHRVTPLDTGITESAHLGSTSWASSENERELEGMCNM
jgi:hypothetical protein